MSKYQIEEYPVTPITSSQRAKLRSMASDMSAIIQLGKGGINDTLVTTVHDALEARELIKLTVLENCDYTPREAADALSEITRSHCVGVIGRKVLLYRASKDSKHPIELK